MIAIPSGRRASVDDGAVSPGRDRELEEAFARRRRELEELFAP